MEPVKEAIAEFEQIFGDSPVFLVRAPGRVNLIGDHTDYADGLVLPMAVDRTLILAAGRVSDSFLDVHSAHYGQRVRVSLADPRPDPHVSWSRYIVGVTALLQDQGVTLGGLRLAVAGDLPPGGGLASSAALEIGVAQALLTAADRHLPPRVLAALCRRAEHEYAGAPCGIMDQLCGVLAQPGHALLIDCRSGETEPIPLGPVDALMIVIDSGIHHSIAGKEYATRRQECVTLLETLASLDPTITSLRDVDEARLASFATGLDAMLLRRARHIVSENARVERAAVALRAGDVAALGRLMVDSHESLRDDFEVSCVELDALVSAARSTPGVYGARMTGGGFGGCVIALAHGEAVKPLQTTLQRTYDRRFAKPAHFYAVASSGAVSVSHLPP